MTLLLRLIAFMGIVLVTVLWARKRLVVVIVSGDSMEPALHEGERVLARLGRPRQLSAGQLVVFRRPPPWQTVGSSLDGPSAQPRLWWSAEDGRAGPELLIKRVAAAAGDRLPEPLAMLAATLGDRVPTGQVLVLGDNPDRSFDSRDFGYLDRGAIIGTVLGRRRQPTAEAGPS